MSAKQNNNKASAAKGAMAPVPLNPERLPQLMGKYSKEIGKTLEEIRVRYTAEGVLLELYGLKGTPFYKEDKEKDHESLSIAEFKATKSKENAPSDIEKARAFRTKFELRLNKEFPQQELKGTSDEAIQAFIDGRPFRERRALMMSQKVFAKEYPNGYTQA